MNHIFKGLEPNVRRILQSILNVQSQTIPCLHNDKQIFKIDKLKLIKFLANTKINHITFYDIDDGSRYSIVFKLESNKHKIIEVLISDDSYRKFRMMFYSGNSNNISETKSN